MFFFFFYAVAGVYLVPMNVPLSERMKSKFWFTVAIVPKTLKYSDTDADAENEKELEVEYHTNLDIIVSKLVDDFEILHKGELLFSGDFQTYFFEDTLTYPLEGTSAYDPISDSFVTIHAHLGVIGGDLLGLAEMLGKVFPKGTCSCHVCANTHADWLNFLEKTKVELVLF